MSRIDPLPDVQGNLYRRVLARVEGFPAPWAEATRALRFQGRLPVDLKEEVRRSTAAQIGCLFCAGLAEPKEVHDDPREELAVRLAKRVADDPKSVDDELFAELKSLFTDDEIVELVALISFTIVGGQTFGAVLGIEPPSAEDALAYHEWLEENMAPARG